LGDGLTDKRRYAMSQKNSLSIENLDTLLYPFVLHNNIMSYVEKIRTNASYSEWPTVLNLY
jgi:hypothetical protein